MRSTCSSCGAAFAGLAAFEAHRVGAFSHTGRTSSRRCLSTPAEMAAAGLTRITAPASRRCPSPSVLWTLARDGAMAAQALMPWLAADAKVRQTEGRNQYSSLAPKSEQGSAPPMPGNPGRAAEHAAKLAGVGKTIVYEAKKLSERENTPAQVTVHGHGAATASLATYSGYSAPMRGLWDVSETRPETGVRRIPKG